MDADPLTPQQRTNTAGTGSSVELSETLTYRDAKVAKGTSDPSNVPATIGRYRVEQLLGRGAFGCVYLARDEELDRRVAIKVPIAERVVSSQDAEAYLAEARTVASLDHPAIVPVHDVGRTSDGACYVVSKFIEGSDLATRIKQSRPNHAESAALVATIAEALHHAHRLGLVHRDVKPANILLDAMGHPYIADFGLALKEQDLGKQAGYAGTPAYMSPEQARGEAHRVDGRSDIFSLGAVFFELLTGQRPFQGKTLSEILDRITGSGAPSPRTLDEHIPAELERICLKALARRASDRYNTAHELADDLQAFQRTASGSGTTSDPTATDMRKMVPKGLRSFDASDSDYFLGLLPGPRDRQGLPESVRFWKTRLESPDPDVAFSVGLLYGPSGCGKSSLVKAGLLPRLASHVRPVYVEATADNTEARLLRGLRKACPALPAELDLIETLTGLRRGTGLASGEKVVIVLDQFEQWLHARRGEESPPLVEALRQADGRRVQVVLMVRDDFWLAAKRFMRTLEIDLVDGHNMALVDLFDLSHARHVLAEIGRAYGRLPEDLVQITADQAAFLDQVVTGVAEDGKVISVRLALFAEMVKSKPWTPATLKAVGGTAGVGINFLEETFSAQAADARHRHHQQAARAVLQALLPESGSDIKGHMHSSAELLAASGCQDRPADFEELLRLLDGELRLITPTVAEQRDDPASPSPAAARQGEPSQPSPSGRGQGEGRPKSSSSSYYQLAHDYLVPSLRDWLTRKQKETRRGRAELLLAERSAAWNEKPENRRLPSVTEWDRIVLFTRRADWTAPQRKMMHRATRWHGARAGAMTAMLVLVIWSGLAIRGRVIEQQNADRASGLVEALAKAETAQVPAIIESLAPYRTWANPPLRDAVRTQPAGSAARLHASLAMLPVDAGEVDYLREQLFVVTPQQFPVVRDALLPHQAAISEQLWSRLQDQATDQDVRLRAAAALARYMPDDPRWEQVSGDVAARLVIQNPLVLGIWTEALQPVTKFLLPTLASFIQDEKRTASERGVCVNLYQTYARNLPEAFSPLENVLAEKVADTKSDASIAVLKRQANARVALLFMGRGERVWPLLRHSPDPTLRSFLIDRIAPFGVEAKALMDRFDQESDVSVRRAILLSLGNFGVDRVSVGERRVFQTRLLQLYRDDPDSGLRGAAEWLLRQWQAADELPKIDRELATGKVTQDRQWYVNRQGQTMVIVANPGEFWRGGQGSPGQEMPLGRNFAIGTKEVTAEQFGRFRPATTNTPSLAKDQPVARVTWYDSVAYCNWLSEQEGLPRDQWCYLPNDRGQYAAGMKPAPGYLQQTGYRLPTEAEWEYACRVGTDTMYSFGNPVELLDRYAWYAFNSRNGLNSVGRLKPNDLGLFDLHGNIMEWTQTRRDSSGRNVSDSELDDNARCDLRGGSFLNQPSLARSDDRSPLFLATSSFENTGFRVARTYP